VKTPSSTVVPHLRGLFAGLHHCLRRGAAWDHPASLLFYEFVAHYTPQIRQTSFHWAMDKWLQLLKTGQQFKLALWCG
jgi:hypothetical protein